MPNYLSIICVALLWVDNYRDVLKFGSNLVLSLALGIFTAIITLHQQNVALQQRLEDRMLAQEQRDKDQSIADEKLVHEKLLAEDKVCDEVLVG